MYTENRKLMRDVEGTPLYSITNENSIAISAEWEHSIANKEPYNKYEPFNSVIITNLSSSHIRFYWNKRKDLGFMIPSSGMRNIDREGFREFTLKNIGSSEIPVDQIEIAFYRIGMSADEQAKKEAKKRYFYLVNRYF